MRLITSALRHPVTILVTVLGILFFSWLGVRNAKIDIFPKLGLPTVYVAQPYGGLSPEQMEGFITSYYEYHFLYITGVKYVDSKSIQGAAIIKLEFNEGTDMSQAMAEVVGYVNRSRAFMPPGTVPPFITRFDAGSVPVGQLVFSSESRSLGEISDLALFRVRPMFSTLPGVSAPPPFGGNQKTVLITVDPDKIRNYHLTPDQVVQALAKGNTISPAGNVRIGDSTYITPQNSVIENLQDLQNMPLQPGSGPSVYVKDIATVALGSDVTTSYALINGKRSVYIPVTKRADASTWDVVQRVKAALPDMQAAIPEDIKVSYEFDQSGYVINALKSLLFEGGLGAILTGLMVWLFLGDRRGALIVVLTIPLTLLTSATLLYLTGQTINIMTLGGLSLAIGMLVDDATVEIENIHRNRSLGKSLTVAIVDGANEIALPAIMATLAICIVFFPVILLTGPALYLFIPMALSVVTSMMASYALSRTLVPLLSRMMLVHEPVHIAEPLTKKKSNIFTRFEALFEKLQNRYSEVLEICLKNRALVLWTALSFLLMSLIIPFFCGSDFFPTTDTGMMKLHYRAAAGTRIEETEKQVARAEQIIQKIIPADELVTINSMLGIPFPINLAFVPTDNVGGMDAEISVALAEDHHPTVGYMKEIRKQLAIEFPGSYAYFQPADIVSQVLNFGLSAPIDVQFESSDLNESYHLAQELMKKMKGIAGVEDVALKQVFNYPGLSVDMDRIKAAQMGIQQSDVANSMIVSLSSSALVAPSYYLNPKNGVNYLTVVKTPLEKLSRVSDILNTPITRSSNVLVSSLTSRRGDYSLLPGASAQRLGNLADISTLNVINSVSHSSVQRVVNVTASAEGRDLGSVTRDIQKAVDSLGKLKPGTKISIRGQGTVMNLAFHQLGLGLLVSILLVYLLMVVLFQSWLDPFIVIVAVPGALCGILWMLLLTGTTINVESFMGAIMAVGIAASNAILLVSFANEVRLTQGLSPLEAALAAGKTRLRPVMMTALAMMIGMMPAALALGEGGEQNAPLGRAVIGGLLVATVTTLLVVPVVYSLIRKELPTKHLLDQKLREESEGRFQ